MKKRSMMRRVIGGVGAVCLLAIFCMNGMRAEAQVAVQDARPIKVGMSVALTGPDATVGLSLAQGVRAALARLDTMGGIGGRPVSLMLLDDGGEPSRTVANTRALLEQGVVAFTSYQGTAGVEASMKLLDGASVPMVGVASGADSLRDPPRPWLFNLRASVANEAAALVSQLDTVGITDVAVIGLSDGLGRTAMEGVQTELARIGVRPVIMAMFSHASGPSANLAEVGRVCAAPPASIVLAMPPTNALTTIRAARGMACQRKFVALSDVGAELAALGATNEELAGMVVVQVLPSPRGNHMLAQDARRDVTRFEAKATLNYPQLEGYLAGRVLVDSLRGCARRVSAACVLNWLNQRKLEVAGYRLNFAPDDRRGSRFVELTVFDASGHLRR